MTYMLIERTQNIQIRKTIHDDLFHSLIRYTESEIYGFVIFVW